MAAVLSMCLLFKTVQTIVSSYRIDNTHLKYSKWKEKALKWYYDKKKNHFNLFFLNYVYDFETMFTKHSLSEILNLNFEKMTVYLTAIF